jgi:DNA-binding response OmpR family regulator
MTSVSLRPSEIIAAQRAEIKELLAYTETLKAALVGQGIEFSPPPHELIKDLTPQERALVVALFAAYPNVVNRWALLEVLPGHDHAQDRAGSLVSVKVHHVRKRLGMDAIKCIRGEGYSLGDELYRKMKPPLAS